MIPLPVLLGARESQAGTVAIGRSKASGRAVCTSKGKHSHSNSCSAHPAAGKAFGDQWYQKRHPATKVAVCLLRVMLLSVAILPLSFPLIIFGWAGYGPDQSLAAPATCNGVVGMQYLEAKNLHWDEFGDTYILRMLVSTFCALCVSVLTCVGTRYVPSPSAFVTSVRGCLFLNWIVAVLWNTTRACQWCANIRKLYWCVLIWNVRQLAWVSSMIWLTCLLSMRVVAIQRAQGINTYADKLACVIAGQCLFFLAGIVCTAIRFAKFPKSEPLGTATESILVAITVLLVSVVIVAVIVFLHPLRMAKDEVNRAFGRRRQEVLSAVGHTKGQLGVTVACAFTSMAGLAADFYSHVMWGYHRDRVDFVYEIVKTGLFGLDLVANSLALLVLSGLLADYSISHRKISQTRHSHSPTGHAGWDGKVEELAQRALTVEALLDFYDMLPQYMPHFDPKVHTTADAVRQAIIPLSAQSEFGPCALATKLMGGQRMLAQRLVTHAWSNRFVDLLAAIVADALGLTSYECVSSWLQTHRIAQLKHELHARGALQIRYWVCAFSVNQHAAICSENRQQGRDSVTQLTYPVCTCCHAKYDNDTSPRWNGEGIECEMNKFQEVMSFLASRDPSFRQVVAVDCEFTVFMRVWCIAEIHEAYMMHMNQVLVLHSPEVLESHRHRLQDLRVEDAHASRDEDRQLILTRIGDSSSFNESLRWMLLDESDGLFAECRDAVFQAEVLGRIAERQSHTASS